MRAMLAVLLMVSQAAALQTRGRSALRLRGGSAEVAQQEQTNATRSDYVVKGTIGAAGTGALVWGIGYSHRRAPCIRVPCRPASPFASRGPCWGGQEVN